MKARIPGLHWEDLMPKRSNPFQAMIHRIETLLYGKSATVVESAMVMDYAAGKEVEVDLLITFEVGGRTYRTVVECRDHSRPSEPKWIRELATKRQDLRVDRIVAVHSEGFSEGAENVARAHGVELIGVLGTSDEKVVDSVSPPTRIKYTYLSPLTFTLIPARMSDRRADNPHGLIFPNGNRLERKGLMEATSYVVGRFFEEQGMCGDAPLDEEVEFNLRCLLPPSTKAFYPSGPDLFITAMAARGLIRIVKIKTESEQTFQYNDSKVINITGSVGDWQAVCTVAGKESPMPRNIFFKPNPNPAASRREFPGTLLIRGLEKFATRDGRPKKTR